MAIPDFQTVMLPVLKCLAGKDVVSSAQIVEQVSDEFALTSEQRAELMIEHNVGVSVKEIYQVKTLDSDYFDGFLG